MDKKTFMEKFKETLFKATDYTGKGKPRNKRRD